MYVYIFRKMSIIQLMTESNNWKEHINEVYPKIDKIGWLL